VQPCDCFVNAIKRKNSQKHQQKPKKDEKRITGVTFLRGGFYQLETQWRIFQCVDRARPVSGFVWCV
jgi:hypothetical protein